MPYFFSPDLDSGIAMRELLPRRCRARLNCCVASMPSDSTRVPASA